MTDELKKAELAAHRYDGLGAPMTFYQPHVAALRAKAGLKDRREPRAESEPVDEMLIATRETQGQPVDAEPRKIKHSATCECPECWQMMERG